MTAAHRLLWVLRALLGAVLLFSGSAYALIPPSAQYRAETNYGNSPWMSSGDAACDAVKSLVFPSYTNGGWTQLAMAFDGVGFCHMTGAPSGSSTVQTIADWVVSVSGSSCPTNSTSVSGGCQCNSGYVEQGSQCVQNQCAAKIGETRIVNWTLGWLRSPDDDDYKFIGSGPNLPAQNACVDGCSYGLGAPVAAWRSQEPNAQGLYRGSVDLESTNLGTACTMAADAPQNPSAPEPECPGYVGEVNGRKGCYGTAQKPVPTMNVPAASKTPLAGNPAAGPKPTSGEGSGTDGAGRTPSAGTGGNAGGPASAAQGGKGGGAGGSANGSGTTGKPGDGKEQQNCGAPGQPVCSVKVDETGTPANVSNAEGYGQGVDTFKDAQKTAIDGAGEKAKTSIGEFGLPFELPSGCSALPSGAFNIVVDICQWQGLIHNLMALVWLSVTAWACIGMVGRTLQGGS